MVKPYGSLIIPIIFPVIPLCVLNPMVKPLVCVCACLFENMVRPIIISMGYHKFSMIKFVFMGIPITSDQPIYPWGKLT